MKKTVCFDDPEYAIQLIQTGIDRFTVVYLMHVRTDLNYAVVYLMHVRTDLNYAGAAAELGECIMHALACDGILDNREKGQK